MICKKCGKEAEFDSAFCYYCGSELKEEQPEQPVSNKKSLGFGIASLACGVYGLSFLIIPFFALAFGIVAVALSKKSLNTKWHKFAKAGRITGKIAIIISSIIMGLLIALLCFYLFAGFFYWLIAVIALMFTL